MQLMWGCGRQNVFDPNRSKGRALGEIGKTGAENAFKRFKRTPIFLARGQSRGALHTRKLLLEPLANHFHLRGTHEKPP